MVLSCMYSEELINFLKKFDQYIVYQFQSKENHAIDVKQTF